MQKILLDLGYQTTAVMSSIQALYEFQQKPDQFDIVITDYTMPNMSGIELTKEILSIRPDIPIILCTGYDESIKKETAVDSGIRELINKPVVTSELSRILSNLLKTRQGRFG